MNIENLTKNIKVMSLRHDKRKVWRNKNKKRYQKWADREVVCTICGKTYVQKRKCYHLKTKKCRKKQGLVVSPRKIRSDKKKTTKKSS